MTWVDMCPNSAQVPIILIVVDHGLSVGNKAKSVFISSLALGPSRLVPFQINVKEMFDLESSLVVVFRCVVDRDVIPNVVQLHDHPRSYGNDGNSPRIASGHSRSDRVRSVQNSQNQ